jgi:hypothetical protein
MIEEIEEDTNKWKDILPARIGRINIVKMSKHSIDSGQSLSNFQGIFHSKIIILKFVLY